MLQLVLETAHYTILSAAEEAIVLALRQSLYLPLDDLLFVTRQHINRDVSRSGIARLLKREGMSRLEDVIPKAEGEAITPKKTFKDYEPGFIYIYIQYLPQMSDETSRRYLFVAIGRATRWVFMNIYGDMTDKSSVDFLRRPKLASPIKINKILTGDGSQFTDRFATKDKKPSGQHAFDVLAPQYLPSIAWCRRGPRKRTAWSSASTVASMNCCSRPASIAGPICRPH